ncbi:MAG: FGGY-family carbohydrate kinase [Chloroflexota bacterium]
MDDAEIGAAEARRPLVLALDLGTSSVRVQLHDARGDAVAGTLARRATAWQTDASGAVWTDVDGLLGLVDELLDEVVEAHRDLLPDVAAGGVSCLFHTFCGVDANHRPATALRSWADTSAASAATALWSRLDGEAVRQRSGAPLHAGYWPARIAAAPAGSATAWAGLPELVHHRLTGAWTLGESLAAGTGLLDRRRGAWDEELCSLLGVDPGSLARVVTELALVPTGHSTSQRWPCLRHVRWLAPVGDGACNNIGLGSMGDRRAGLMIGTSSALRLCVEGSVHDIPEGLFAYGIEGGRTLVGGALSEGGGTAAWLGRVSGRDLSTFDPRPASLVVLPYLNGERGPGYHAALTGAITGLRLSDDADTIMGAIMTSVALGLADIDEALGPPRSITATGGALRPSRRWQQLVAAALGRPIDVARLAEPSLRGAALLALEAAGVAPAESAAPVAVDRIEPLDADARALRSLAQRRADLYRRVIADQT